MSEKKVSDDVFRPNTNQISLEEIDVLTRKCHHLHDEEIAKAVTKLFKRIVHVFKHQPVDGHQHPLR